MGHYSDSYEREEERLVVEREKRYKKNLAKIKKRLDNGELPEILLELQMNSKY